MYVQEVPRDYVCRYVCTYIVHMYIANALPNNRLGQPATGRPTPLVTSIWHLLGSIYIYCRSGTETEISKLADTRGFHGEVASRTRPMSPSVPT